MDEKAHCVHTSLYRLYSIDGSVEYCNGEAFQHYYFASAFSAMFCDSFPLP